MWIIISTWDYTGNVVATIPIHILYFVQNLLSWSHLTTESPPYLKWVTNGVFCAI